MEYFRDENNRIQAGFALNAGKLLVQYNKFSESLSTNEQYDATLSICILQSLLTICSELIAAMRKHDREIWEKVVHDVPIEFGLSRSFVKTNTFSLVLKYREFIEHVRNALSHPTYPEKPPNYPSTGYTTLPDAFGLISHFLFIDSPWVARGKLLSKASSQDEKKVREFADEFKKKNRECGTLEVRKTPEGKYQIFRGDELYIPIFEAQFPVASLKTLAEELANYIAQPTQADWDGNTIVRLVG
jgi:hypothetical protein